MSNNTIDSEKLEDLFKCIICFSKVEDAMLCPHCSSLSCAACISQWLSHGSDCPHCRATIDQSSLVTMNLVSEIRSALKDLPTDVCKDHSIPMNYFCMCCSTSICSDCAILTSNHLDHDIQHISSVYDSLALQVKLEKKKLKQRLQELSKLNERIEIETETINSYKAQTEQEIDLLSSHLQDKIDSQALSKLQVLYDHRIQIYQQIELLENLYSDINNQIALNNRGELIGKSSEILQKIKDLPFSNYTFPSIDLDFDVEIVPSYESLTFKIPQFLKNRLCAEIVYSDSLNYCGNWWRLKVYPNGNASGEGSWISVFVEMMSGIQELNVYEHKIEMINSKDPSSNFCREFSSDLEAGECLGYNRFFRVDLLEEEGFVDSNDTLELKLFVRTPSFSRLHSDQKEYIRHLESVNRSTAAKVELLRQNMTLTDYRKIEESDTNEFEDTVKLESYMIKS